MEKTNLIDFRKLMSESHLDGKQDPFLLDMLYLKYHNIFINL